MDIMLDIIPECAIFSTFIKNIFMQGTVSQNLNVGQTGNFCDFLLFFQTFIFDLS